MSKQKVKINWPNGTFKVVDVATLNSLEVSKVQNYVNKAVKEGRIKIVALEGGNRRGRKARVFSVS